MLISLSFFLRCTERHAKNKGYKEIQLSYSNGWEVSSSLKVTENCSVFRRDNTTGRCLTGKLERQDSATLDSLLSQIDILELDTLYKPVGYSINDCSTFRLFIRMDNQQKTITSECAAPEKLELFKSCLIQISRVAKTPINCTANFNETDRGFIASK